MSKRNALHLLALVLLLCFLQINADSASCPASDTSGGNCAPNEPMICVIIRTFWGHGKFGNYTLRRLINNLQEQNHKRWFAQLIVLDHRPFPDLRHIVRGANDTRLWVYADWVSHKFAPKTEDGKWTPGYHNKLYNLTDEAIRVCPPDTEWVVATNGDNSYDKNFMDHIVAAPADADLLSFDYYSRYQRPTGPLCDRFAAGAGMPMCKVNEAMWCQTDLAANVYRWKRLLKEDRRFGLVDPNGFSADGYMVQWMQLGWGWKVHKVTGRCLVEHSPTPQMCARNGGVWDDTHAGSAENSGGACLHGYAASQRAKQPEIEEVTIDVTYDPESFDFPKDGPLKLRCLRPVNRMAWTNEAFFGPFCAAAVDRPSGDNPYERRAEAELEWSKAWAAKQQEVASGQAGSVATPLVSPNS